MKLKFSDQDRALISQQQREIPWQGIEGIVLARYELGEALRLEAFHKGKGAIEFAKLSDVETFTVDLKKEAVEQLVWIVAGGGMPMNGEHAPKLGALVAKIRKACPPPKAEKE